MSVACLVVDAPVDLIFGLAALPVELLSIVSMIWISYACTVVEDMLAEMMEMGGRANLERAELH